MEVARAAARGDTVKMWRRVYGYTAHVLIIVLRSKLSPFNALTLCHDASGTTRRCFLSAGSSEDYFNIWEKEASAGRPVIEGQQEPVQVPGGGRRRGRGGGGEHGGVGRRLWQCQAPARGPRSL